VAQRRQHRDDDLRWGEQCSLSRRSRDEKNDAAAWRTTPDQWRELRCRGEAGGVRRHRSHASDGALRRQRGWQRRKAPNELQRQGQRRDRLVGCGAIYLSVRRRAGDRGLVDEAVWLSAGEKVSARALHPRRTALGVRRELVRRVPESGRCGDVRAVHESARLERLRRGLHVQHARAPKIIKIS